jgi:dolichol-phosphate mannosyltransferase
MATPARVSESSPPREVPTYNIYEFHPRQTRYAVLIPVLEEGDRLLNQLQRMKFLRGRGDVVIGDGGSKDTCGDPGVLRTLAVRTLLVKTSAGKQSAQLRMLLDYASNQGYEGFVLIDGNNKDGVDAIPSFFEAMDQGFDYIQGSRFIEGGEELNTPWDRKLAASFLHAPLISLAAGFRYTDTTNGFRALTRRVALDARMQLFRDVFHSYEMHSYMAVRIPRLGFRVKELPVTRIYPKGATPSKIRGIGGRVEMFKILFKAALSRYNPK